MKHTTNLTLLCCTLAVALPALRASESTPDTRKTVPELFAGEVDDIGPQFLVKEAAVRPKRFALWSRADISGTDNATYSADDPRSSSVTSVQAGVDANLWKRESGKANWRIDAGVRGQIYRYGILGDSDKIIDFLEVNSNNFDLLSAQVRASWQRGPWLAEAVSAQTWMKSQSTEKTFYRDFSQTVALYRQWQLPKGMALVGGASLGKRWSSTYSYGLLPDSWNDRNEATLIALLHVPIGRSLTWRTMVRAYYANYAHRDRDRDDLTGAFGTELSWRIVKGVAVHVYGGHESRASSEIGMPDYHRWELGTGCALRWDF